MQDIYGLLSVLADLETTVLITDESGTENPGRIPIANPPFGRRRR